MLCWRLRMIYDLNCTAICVGHLYMENLYFSPLIFEWLPLFIIFHNRPDGFLWLPQMNLEFLIFFEPNYKSGTERRSLNFEFLWIWFSLSSLGTASSTTLIWCSADMWSLCYSSPWDCSNLNLLYYPWGIFPHASMLIILVT